MSKIPNTLKAESERIIEDALNCVMVGWTLNSKFVRSTIGTTETDIISDARARNDAWNSVDAKCRWSCTYLLDPSDPLFVEIGEVFIRRQVKGLALLFRLCILETTPNGGMGVSSFSLHKTYVQWPERPVKNNADEHLKCSTAFPGNKTGLWCMLHDFGGNIEMYGIFDAISSGPVDARVSKNSTMVGVGMCMEGIEQNPVVYELMSEMAFRSEKVQLLEWLKSYSHGRYGKAIHQVEAAWEILYHTIYNCMDVIEDHNTDFIVKLPDWDPSNTSSPLPQAHLWYSTQKVIKALRLLIDAGNNFAGSVTYRYDLVDLTRQVLSKLANQVYLDAVTAFQQKDSKALNLHSKKFIQLIKDIDILLAYDDNFLLGTWLKSANKLAKNPHELKLYEWNARTQVTMWFDNTGIIQSKLHDYANKFWSGLLEGYYLPRASAYFDYLLRSLREKENFKMEEWRKEWISFSNKWQVSQELYPVSAEGDALPISKALYEKYFGKKNWKKNKYHFETSNKRVLRFTQ
uniref:Alpha-N-acetylglucosaminidase n=1 Tax=Quercus lobata TaxID=97700 RepID=A0A7N2LDD6_QUELO